MSTKIVVTTKNIDARIKSWSGRGLSITNEVQDCLAVAFDYYLLSDSKNALYLTKVWRGAVSTKGLNANKLKDYILAVCPNLEHKKDKSDQLVFLTKAKLKTAPADVDVTLSTTLWAEYKKDGGASAFDLDKAVQSLVNKAMKDNDTTTRDQLIAALDKALAVNAVKSATEGSKVTNIKAVA